MQVKDPTIPLKGNAKDTVLSFVTALNNEDYNEARKYVNDDMTFDGVMGSRNGADAYFSDMEKMRFKYDIKKAFVDDTDVCILSDIEMSGKTIFVCSWYKLEDGRISSLKVVFDPRPILNK
jgi:hypothetical protein